MDEVSIEQTLVNSKILNMVLWGPTFWRADFWLLLKIKIGWKWLSHCLFYSVSYFWLCILSNFLLLFDENNNIIDVYNLNINFWRRLFTQTKVLRPTDFDKSVLSPDLSKVTSTFWLLADKLSVFDMCNLFHVTLNIHN